MPRHRGRAHWLIALLIAGLLILEGPDILFGTGASEDAGPWVSGAGRNSGEPSGFAGPAIVAATPDAVRVRVQRGDTLWKLALRHGPEREDPRRVVARILAENRLSSPILYPGQTLQIPVR